MSDEELRNLIGGDGSVFYSAASFLAVAFFVMAAILNRKLEGNKWSPFVVMPIGIIGSLMLYASSWSTTICGWIAGFLNGVGAMFGGDMPVNAIMGIVCIIAMVATIVDLWFDAGYNAAAVWALIIAPIAAQGAAGGVGGFVNGAYSALTIGAIKLVTEAFGA
jgi:hypothetical protein